MKRIVIILVILLSSVSINAETISTIIDVPYNSQTYNTCGQTCLTMVFAHYDFYDHFPLNENDVIDIQKYQEENVETYDYSPNTSIAELTEIVVGYTGYNARYYKDKDIDFLKSALLNDIPPIVVVTSRMIVGEEYHSMVLVEIDDEYAYFNDPDDDKDVVYTVDQFIEVWSSLGSWVLLIAPDDDILDEMEDPEEIVDVETTISTISNLSVDDNSKEAGCFISNLILK